MKMLRILVLPMLLLLLTAGCTSKTEYGECIGFFDEDNPHLQYKLSIWNTFIAVVFSETLVVPIVYAADYAKCPVGHKIEYK